MPESRIERTCPSLPVGYQFGDAKWTPEQVIAAREVERRTVGVAIRFLKSWDIAIDTSPRRDDYRLWSDGR